MSDIKYYLTSIEPDLAQTIGSQSLGGYPSTSLVYAETPLASDVGLYDSVLSLNNYLSLYGLEYINIGSEIIKVEPISGNSVNVLQRGVNEIVSMHIVGDCVRGEVVDEVFNDTFNEYYKQYRCVAIKNTSDNLDPSANLVAYNMFVYLEQDSRNIDAEVMVSLEIPKHQNIESISSSWTNISLTDDSLIGGDLEDNDAKNSYLRILSGPNIGRARIINSYDSSTGTFIFIDSLPVDYSSSYSKKVTYEVDPSPSQRIKTGTESPIVGTSNVTSFVLATEANPISIDVIGANNGKNFYSKNVIYLWLERTMKKGSNAFDNNDIIIGLKYSTVS
jgi:hypothetical protein